MNYLMEIRLFYDRLEIHPLPPTVISLWFAMMHIANKSGWPEEISIPVSTLEVKTGLERRGVYRARSILHDAGMISFRERPGNKCAIYKLVPMESLLYKSDTQVVTQTGTEPEPCGTDLSHNVSHSDGLLCNSDTQSVPQTGDCCTDLSRSVSPLDKQNLSIDKKTEIDNGGTGKKRKKSPPAMAKKKAGFDLSFIGDDVWESLVRSWLDYKTSRGEGYKSELSVKKFHTMLRNLSRGDPALATKIVDKSIARNWAGIFEMDGSDGIPASGRATKPAAGQHIGQIKQPEDEERRQKLLDKFDNKK